jgi:DNA replication protein DnaC
MDDEEFKTVVESGVLHPLVTLREIEEVRGRSSAKPKQQFVLHVDLNRIATQSRQAEFVRELKALLEKFDFDWEPMAPKRQEQLSSLLAEFDEQNQAA